MNQLARIQGVQIIGMTVDINIIIGKVMPLHDDSNWTLPMGWIIWHLALGTTDSRCEGQVKFSTVGT
jgi:hypothetical protein